MCVEGPNSLGRYHRPLPGLRATILFDMTILRAAFSTHAEFLSVYDTEISKFGLLIRGATLDRAAPGDACTVSITVGSETAIECVGQIAALVPTVGVAVMFVGIPESVVAFASKLRSRSVPAPQASLFDRLKALSVPEKTQLALSGSREERMALLRDSAKTIHIFVLKNPRLGIDEVQFAAKQANLAPEALKMIADHRDWSQNPTVCTALVRNPKTPIPIALKLIDRVPASDLKLLAKGGARDQIVLAARRRLAI